MAAAAVMIAMVTVVAAEAVVVAMLIVITIGIAGIAITISVHRSAQMTRAVTSTPVP